METPSRYRLEILAVLTILVFSVLFLWAGNGGFTGTDERGSARVSEMTGIPEEGFRPLVWQWVPPGPEVESALFALQAAIGGIVVGWVFGYWNGQKGKGSRKEGKG